MMVCEMLLVAKYVANRIRVASEAGTGGICNPLQKLINLNWPAEYVVLVEAAKLFA